MGWIIAAVVVFLLLLLAIALARAAGRAPRWPGEVPF